KRRPKTAYTHSPRHFGKLKPAVKSSSFCRCEIGMLCQVQEGFVARNYAAASLRIGLGTPSASCNGRLNSKLAPSPDLLATRMQPPCASTTCLTMANPNPSPPVLCGSVSNLSNTLPMRSAGMPSPESRTQQLTLRSG